MPPQRREAYWPPAAKAFVEVLREARRGGTPALTWSEIRERLEARGFHPERARDVRRGVPDWDEVVTSLRRGLYALKP